MTFTDDDLKRLKDETQAHWEWMKPLLARLEAAEKVVECAIDCYGMDSFVVNAWRQAAGK
jgi:hypothetical protein